MGKIYVKSSHRCIKKRFLKFLQNSQKNTCARCLSLFFNKVAHLDGRCTLFVCSRILLKSMCQVYRTIKEQAMKKQRVIYYSYKPSRLVLFLYSLNLNNVTQDTNSVILFRLAHFATNCRNKIWKFHSLIYTNATLLLQVIVILR